MYPTRDDNGDVRSPPFVTQFENLCSLVNQQLPKVDGDLTKPQTPYKDHYNSSFPVDAVFVGGTEDEYATHVAADSTRTAYIHPLDWID
jgi:hypothetical protein